MLSAKQIEKFLVKDSKLKGLVTPNYSGLGISDIIPSVQKGFGLPSQRGLQNLDPSMFKDVKNVVFFVCDGLGYDFLNKTSLLKKMEGFPITSVAPSTTPVALSTLATGLTPQEHGLIGFWLYLEELGDVVSMLRFGPASDMGSYQDVGILPEIFFPSKTTFETLGKKGISSAVVNKKDFAQSPLSQMIYRGAEMLPYHELPELFSKAHSFLNKRGKKFLYLYWDNIDVISHMEGTKSKILKEQLAELEGELERFLGKLKPGTLFLLTGDHGEINIPMRKSESLLNHPDLLKNLAAPPSGEFRLVYLYAKRGKKPAVKDYLESHFSKKAYVLESSQLIERGFLGVGKPMKETLARIGDFTLIAKDNYLFTYPFLEGRGDIGFHGGLSKEEMLVPFLWKRV